MYKLIFFVPTSHVEEVKNAVFLAGGGNIGHYRQCCWQTLGVGEFLPDEEAKPYLGHVGEKQIVSEFKVEILVEADKIEGCVAALRLAHPYESPAIDIIKIEAITR